MTVVRATLLTFFVWSVFLLLSGKAFAQTPCGNIIEPSNWLDPQSSLLTHPIADCNDPFNLSTGVSSPYTLFINESEVREGDSIVVSHDGTTQYRIEGNPILSGFNGYFFLHDGDDYRYVDTSLSEPGETEYRNFAVQFFPPGTDIEPYIETILSGDYFLQDSLMQEQLYAFLDYVSVQYEPVQPALTPGTYTLVLREYELTVGDARGGLFDIIRSLFISTAFAQSLLDEYTFAITFTLTEESETGGVSNILFLPGMQGSRLYMKEGDDEVQLWEPFGSEDYEKLRMTDAGVSENEVYTRDVIDSIYFAGIGGDVYDSFVEFLDELDGEEGPLVQIFPYDWRYDVFDLVENGTRYETGLYKKLVETVEYLATLSDTGKVTIITHSNGGLLAKALMIKLEELGRADEVDKIIFIAAPHTGTPKAIAALLHGYDQEQSMNIPADARDIRAVIKNMPGPHGLLPSEAYVSSLSEPLISFDNSETTRLYRDRYGFTINNIAEYRDFLNGVEGREEVHDTIALPTKTNSGMLDTALEHHTALDTWEAPEGVEVFNIVGTGIETPKAITYQRFDTSICDIQVESCFRIDKLEPVVEFTRRGDETVVLKSALAVDSVESLYFDIGKFTELETIFSTYKHANITEADPIKDLVDKILHGSSTDGIEYISNTEPDTDSGATRIDKIHSPARIYIEDSNGRRTGRDSSSQEWREEIPGTSYFEIGGVKYILKPDNLNHRVVIEGEGIGVFTHAIDELVDEEQSTLHTLVATVTPTTRVSYSYTNGTTSPVSVDQNGDGTTDYQLTIDGVVIDTKATYLELKTAIRNLKLPKLKEVVVLGIADQAEQFYKKRTDPRLSKTYEKLEEGALYLLDQTLIQLKKAKLIKADAYQGIKSIIDKLIKQ